MYHLLHKGHKHKTQQFQTRKRDYDKVYIGQGEFTMLPQHANLYLLSPQKKKKITHIKTYNHPIIKIH